jgi:hypothetical protein
MNWKRIRNWWPYALPALTAAGVAYRFVRS